MVNSAVQISALARVTPMQTTAAPPEDGEKFLRFQLGTEAIALLPLSIITQVMQVSVPEILPVPQMPGCVLGIYNWRGEMLWLIDLGQLVGFPPLLGPDIYLETVMAIAIQANDQSLGLIVPQINDIESHNPQHLHPPAVGLFPPEILSYLQGYLIGANKEVLMVLNAEALVEAPLWQTHKS